MNLCFSNRLLAWCLFAAGCMLVAAAYWPGLHGPFLLDDFGNLADVGSWLDGDRTWLSVILNNRSGPGGRPLAMASFVLDGALWGKDVWHFKLTNLVVHLLCGLTMLMLYRRLLARDPALAPQQAWLPMILALAWLALPINVSSVLYVVQRMAMLSALFMLLSLWLFVVARERIERGQRSGIDMLWIGVPALVVLGFFCKENALLVPLMAGAIELAYFRPSGGQRRPRVIAIFFGMSVALPALLACILFALYPERLLGGYALRDFTLVERLLTQPRVLWDYVGSIFVPFGPRLGLFHDNYPKSVGLLTPWTTLTAILGWLVVLAAGWRVRRSHPSILAGILLYLAGHAMESSVFSLELYFEHRNYLPEFGLLLAAVGAIDACRRLLPPPTRMFRLATAVAPVLLIAVYLVGTHGRARVWASLDTLYAQELRYNPESPRLRSFLAGQAMEAGDMKTALAHIDASARYNPTREAMTLSLWRMLAYCAGKTAPPGLLYEELERNAHGQIETYAMTAWELLANKVEQGSCPRLQVPRLIKIGTSWLEQNPLPPNAQQSWRTRYYLARLLASQSRFEESAAQASRAWQDSGYNSGVGVFSFQVNATLGNIEMCREILARLQTSSGQGNLNFDEAVKTFQHALADQKLKPK